MSLVTRLFTPSRPAVALEIASTRVSALRLGGGSPPSATYAVEPLPAGAVVSSLTTPNVVDQAGVSAAVGRVLAAAGGGRQVALVLPDSVAKVSLVRLEQVPTRLPELDAMLRFQVRKSVPFRADDAQFCLDGWREGGRRAEYRGIDSRRERLRSRTVPLLPPALCGPRGSRDVRLVNLLLYASGRKEDFTCSCTWRLTTRPLMIVAARVLCCLIRGRQAESLEHLLPSLDHTRTGCRAQLRALLSRAARRGPKPAAGAKGHARPRRAPEPRRWSHSTTAASFPLPVG
jgi:hypothetical protein